MRGRLPLIFHVMVIDLMEECLNRRNFFRITHQLMAGSGVISIKPADQMPWESRNDGRTRRAR